jgi:predicted Zn-dependent protease
VNEVAIRRELWLAIDRAYKGATQAFAAKEAAREGRDGPFTADLGEADAVIRDHSPHTPPSLDKLTERIHTVSLAVSGDPHLEDSTVDGNAWSSMGLVQNTAGTRAWLPASTAIVRAEVLGRAKDGARLRNTRSWIAKDQAHLPTTEEMASDLSAASSWIAGLVDAPVEEDYLGPVLFEPLAAAELFRQLLHPEISGTPPLESAPENQDDDSRPIPVARLGRRLLPQGWSVTDNPTGNPELASYYTHDDEAVPAKAVSVIEDGVLKDVLMSRVPRSDRSQSTGHGRSTGKTRRNAMPAQVTVQPARPRRASALRRTALKHARSADLPYVLIVRRLTPPALSQEVEFAFTGDGPLQGLTVPSEVIRLYQDGREEPVRGLRFSGVDRRTLRDIVAAGATEAPIERMDDSLTGARFSIQKFGGIPVSWAVPAVVIGEMELRGSSGGEDRVIPAPISVQP